jgi:hypothetical protein
MNTAELIYQEAKTLPDNLSAEVLDFICFLKSRHSGMIQRQVSESEKLAELEAFFAPYRRDLSGFRFDRDEANER